MGWNAKSRKDLTILHAAAMKNRIETAEYICNMSTRQRTTGQRTTCQDMINDDSNEYNATPSIMAIRYEGGKKMVRLLKSYGADLETEVDGKTPIEWARHEGRDYIAYYIQELINNQS